jgi:hypothetical protein
MTQKLGRCPKHTLHKTQKLGHVHYLEGLEQFNHPWQEHKSITSVFVVIIPVLYHFMLHLLQLRIGLCLGDASHLQNLQQNQRVCPANDIVKYPEQNDRVCPASRTLQSPQQDERDYPTSAPYKPSAGREGLSCTNTISILRPKSAYSSSGTKSVILSVGLYCHFQVDLRPVPDYKKYFPLFIADSQIPFW